jgi:hypothetical protein
VLGRVYHLLVSFMLLAAGGILLYGAARDHLKAYESLGWPERAATVTQERLSEDGSVEVLSMLEGKSFHQRVPFSFALSFDHESRRSRARLKARYAAGNRVTIHYSPGAPATEAVLRPGYSILSLALMAAGAVLVLAGLAFALRPPALLSAWFSPAVQSPDEARVAAGSHPRTHAAVVSRGRRFALGSDGILTSTIIDRRLMVTVGLLLLGAFGWLFYLDWQGALAAGWMADAAGLISVISLGAGLIAIGLRKAVKLSRGAQRAWVESGWFAFSASAYQTSAWPLAAFDRILIERVNLLGLESPAPRSPQRGGPGVRFRVTLLGDSVLAVNGYREYRDALKLAYCLSSLTGYPLIEAGPSV